MFGQCKWYSKEKGFGFITPDNGSQDIFLHRSQLEKSRITILETGDRVEFDTEPGKKGEQAVNIRLMPVVR